MAVKQAVKAAPKVKPKAATTKLKSAPTKGKGKVAAVAAAPKAPPAPKFQPGEIVAFAGYRAAMPDPLFKEVGEHVYIHSLGESEIEAGPQKGRKITTYICVRLEDMEAAKNDPKLENVTAEPLKASELRVVKVVPVEPEYHPVAVGDVVEHLKANSLTQEIKKLFESEAKTEFEIGGLLAFMWYEERGKKEITSLGYHDTDADGNAIAEGSNTPVAATAWQNYLAGEFDMRDRKAEELIKIYKAFSAIPEFDPRVLSHTGGIGWSKAALIAGYIPKEGEPDEIKAKADEIITLAAEQPIRDLRGTMKERYVGETGRTPAGAQVSTRAKRVDFKFSLAEAQAEGVKLVFQHAGKMLNIDDPNQVFEQIIMQWAVNGLSGAVNDRIRKEVAKHEKPTAKPVTQATTRLVKARPAAAKAEAAASA